jgi:hypothetical protein
MSSIKRYRSLKKVLKKYVDEPTDETYTDACDAIYGYIEEAVGEDGLDPDNDTFEGYKEAVGEGNVGELDEEIFALSDKASNETLSADQIKILFRRIKAYIKTHAQGGGGTRKRKSRSRKSRTSRKSRKSRSRR